MSGIGSSIVDNKNFFGIQGDVVNQGFRPELYTIDPTGGLGYADNAAHNPSTASSGNFNDLLLGNTTTTVGNQAVNALTKARFRQHFAPKDKEVDFEICITLDVSGATGATGIISGNQAVTDELRIRSREVDASALIDTTLATLELYRGQYQKHLPEPTRKTVEPLFQNVSINDLVTNLPVPIAAGAFLVEARLLSNGSIALLKRQAAVALGSGNQSPLLVSDLDGAIAAADILKINIRGSYRAV